jgi:hypothetical protein
LGTTAPEGSVTLPASSPRVDWAKVALHRARTSKRVVQANFIPLVMLYMALLKLQRGF